MTRCTRTVKRNHSHAYGDRRPDAARVNRSEYRWRPNDTPGHNLRPDGRRHVIRRNNRRDHSVSGVGPRGTARRRGEFLFRSKASPGGNCLSRTGGIRFRLAIRQPNYVRDRRLGDRQRAWCVTRVLGGRSFPARIRATVCHASRDNVGHGRMHPEPGHRQAAQFTLAADVAPCIRLT